MDMTSCCANCGRKTQDYPIFCYMCNDYYCSESCGKLRDMRHPSFTINKEVKINDYCTRRGVFREMAYRHIKERVRNS